MFKYIIPFLLIGCHGSINLHSDVAVDSSFTQEQLSNIIEATDQWKNTTNGLVDLNIIIANHPEEYGNDTMKIIMNPDSTMDGEFNIFGVTNFVIGVSSITLYPNRVAKSPYPFKEIVLHELGHSLGLHHVSEGLMTPVPTNINCIDDVTLSQFCDIHYCDKVKIKSDCE